MRFALFLIAVTSLPCSVAAYADTTYSFQGKNYTQATAPFTTSESLSGSFTVAGSLGANISTYQNATLLSYSFTDGVDQFTSGTPLNQYVFQPITDANGKLVDFYLELTLFTPTGGAGYYGQYANIQYGSTFTGGPNGTYVSHQSLGGFASASSGVDGVLTTAGTATTPEPSSILLSATGLLMGFSSVLRGRLGGGKSLFDPSPQRQPPAAICGVGCS